MSIDDEMKAKRTGASVPQNNMGKGADYSLVKIKAFASGDPESTMEILQSLVRSTEQNMRLFRQSLQINDYKSLTELAHKMLPMFRLLEAEAIVVPLAEMEQNGADSAYSNVEITSKAVLPEIEKLVETIKTEQQIVTG